MSSATLVLSETQAARSPLHTVTIYLKEAKYEFLKNLRLRVYTASVLSFPVMFYVLFGLVLNAKEAIAGTRVPIYLIATTPAIGAVVRASPREVSLTYDEAVTINPGALAVVSGSGRRVDSGIEIGRAHV